MEAALSAETLRKQAYIFAEEIRDGKWDQILPSNEPLCSGKAVAELRRRCPGFTDREYSAALSIGYRNAIM